MLYILNPIYTKNLPLFWLDISSVQKYRTPLGLSRDKIERQHGKNASLTPMYNIAYKIGPLLLWFSNLFGQEF